MLRAELKWGWWALGQGWYESPGEAGQGHWSLVVLSGPWHWYSNRCLLACRNNYFNLLLCRLVEWEDEKMDPTWQFQDACAVLQVVSVSIIPWERIFARDCGFAFFNTCCHSDAWVLNQSLNSTVKKNTGYKWCSLRI